MYFKDIKFPPSYRYSSDSDYIPLEFYEETFPIAKQIDLTLGYFSSNAIKILSQSFAQFVYNGGVMRLITNHIYSNNDYKNLIEKTELENEDLVINIFNDISEIEKNLSLEGQHFFDCLKYLLKRGQLTLIPVKFNEVDLAHCKKMILFDGKDYILTDGSINFTMPALIKNSESFQVETPWNGEVSCKRIEEEKSTFEKIFSNNHPNYSHIDKREIEVIIHSIGRDKDVADLLDDSLKLPSKVNSKYASKIESIFQKRKLRFEGLIEKIRTTPKFPFNSKPREYQEEAYDSWVKNNYSGVFAMATGTGKTITSLNCILNLYVKDNYYRVIILVPSIALLNQWEEEVQSFNFKNILKVGGGNNWEKEFSNYTSNYSWGLKSDLVIIATYGSFILNRFQNQFKKIQTDFTLIADEAHNMGASSIKNVISTLKLSKKIALSATPKRIYDPEGTEAIDKFFNDSPPYTYSFDMEKALNEGHLTPYKYFPKIVELNDEEFKEYTDISIKLLNYFDFETGKFKDDPIVEILLLKRKNIIHKAESKIAVFQEIVSELIKTGKDKYIFAYIPEGFKDNDLGVSEKILEKFLKTTHNQFPSLTMNTYTSQDQDLKEILRGFSEGKINMLFAMKMLDEGVDVPRAEVGIFASSTGNPRQFIQRRGRLLRNHKHKTYSTIYDMVVIPKLNSQGNEYYNIEKNLVHNELNRVAYFASLSMNYYDSRDILDNICRKYDLSLDTIINEL